MYENQQWTNMVAVTNAQLGAMEAGIVEAQTEAAAARAEAKAASDAAAAAAQAVASHTHTSEPAPAPAPSSGASSWLDVDAQFGGTWEGVKKAVAEAERSGGPSAVVVLGKGYGFTDTINHTRPITVMGGGTRATRLWHEGSFAGPAFRCENMKRSGQWESTQGSGPIQSYDEMADDGGMIFRDFSIVDNDRSVPNRQGIYCIDADDMLMDNLQFGFLTGTALKLGGDDADARISGVSSGRIRESDFRRIRIYRCGSGSPTGSPDVPAFILQNGNDSGDGSNQNFFHQFRFVYNEGRMLIRGAGFDGNSLRRTIFRDMQLHALADNQNWSPVQYFPFDLVTLEGAVRETIIDGLTVNGNRAGTACFATKGHALNTQTPKRLVIRNANIVNVHGSLVRAEKLDSVSIDGFGLGSVAEWVLDSPSGSGLARYKVEEHGINNPAGKVRIASGTGKTLFSGFEV